MNDKQQEIEKQIKDVSGNEPVLEELYKLLGSEEAIAFVGAGASAGLWPLWDEFLAKFIEHSLKLGKITKPEADYFKKDAPQNPLETAQQLRNKIGERYYFEYLQEIFKDKTSPQTGGAFTLTHKALLQLPIHNYLTLNYDAGLTNARDALYEKATTSYFFWDQEEARRIRERGYKRLVLHAHGRHDRTDSIILTLNDYRKAYDKRSFVRLLEDIFAFEELIFVGFGMTDPYVKQMFNNISKDYKKSPFQHVAFVGLNKAEMKVANLHREKVEMVYGARVLFYPTENNHQALTDWLNMLVEKYSETAGSRTAEEIKPIPASPEIKAALEDKYIHQPTDDENFKGRADDFALLNRWANDPDTRTIAITGIGGQGKTAMTGRWLKHERHDNLKDIPVFYWSFYVDLDVEKFLKQVMEFCLPIRPVIGEIEPISYIISVVQQVRLLLVLDGLEVLQEDATKPNHGAISHPLLYPFLQNWVKTPHKGLMVLTSRFHFPQLARYSGVGFHQLDLVRLSKADGVSLLKRLNILGDDEILENYVEKLNGHPLALRVLASAVKRGFHGDITKCKDEQILFESGEGRLSEKLQHLLGFYEKQLKGGQKELLGIISLFKRPVETKSFVTLLGKMKSLNDTPLAKADASTIEKQLNILIDDFLIEKTDEGITTHPVIRDYFHRGCKIAGARREVADFLKAKSNAERPLWTTPSHLRSGAPLTIENEELKMNEIQINTIETRRFISPQFATPFEIEFHRNPTWVDILNDTNCILSKEENLEGQVFARLAARIALTGSALPPISILQSPGEHVPLDTKDTFNLAFIIADFGSVPTEEDYSNGSRYLKLRSIIESKLELKHIHLGIRKGERRSIEERNIEFVAGHLGDFSIAMSGSPKLSFQKFAELLGKNQRVFGFSAGANILLGSSALASGYQIAINQDPIFAIELATAGASAYVILKFGAAVGKKVDNIIKKW